MPRRPLGLGKMLGLCASSPFSGATLSHLCLWMLAPNTRAEAAALHRCVRRYDMINEPPAIGGHPDPVTGAQAVQPAPLAAASGCPDPVQNHLLAAY